MRLIKIIGIYILIIFVFLAMLLYYGLTSTHGAKFILTTLVDINYFSIPNKIYINNISGNLLNQLILQDVTYTKDNHHLNIKNLNIKINWVELIKKQNISIVINKLLGTYNNYPITAKVSFSKLNGRVKLNSISFIEIGDNILTIQQKPHESHMNFHLAAKQLEIFNPQTTGNIIITGEISDNLNCLTANITANKLFIDKKNFGSFFSNKDNTLFVKIKKINNKINATAQVNFEDISPIMNFIPAITRLKGKLNGTINFNWHNKNTEITTDLKLQDITMSLPEYGIKIKPLNIYLTSKNNKKIYIDGKGTMRHGPGEFNLKGYFEPFNDKFINNLQISGENIELINTPGCHLIASLNLKLVFSLQENALHINGDTLISKGTIDLDKQTASKIIKSNDINFVDRIDTNNTNQKNYFRILPNIDLKIESNTKLIGKGLDSIISGKLKIYTADDNPMLLGTGRITIKHGTYTISGQKFLIEKGRIIYLPRTFIANPTLDIKILPYTNTTNNNTTTTEKYLYIEGTLENPIIKDNGLANEHQAILQLLNFGNNQITSSIKEKLYLQEFGIQENEDTFKQFKNKPSEESLLDNKNFVIGKKINNKTNVQYLKTLNTMNNTIRLKYKLNNNWAVGLESSTEDGYGGDLGFCIEK